jgi:hypothetical protein
MFSVASNFLYLKILFLAKITANQEQTTGRVKGNLKGLAEDEVRNLLALDKCIINPLKTKRICFI